MATQPTHPDEKPELDDETKAILSERLKTLERDRKSAIPADEAFRLILQKPKL